MNFINQLHRIFSRNYLLKFLLIEYILLTQASIPASTSSTDYEYSFNQDLLIVNSSSTSKEYNDFISNKPILKSYGPLILDINNLKYTSEIFFIPMLNSDYKPLFLAINCNQSIFNIKGKNEWKGWYTPFFTYELNIFNDFCSD